MEIGSLTTATYSSTTMQTERTQETRQAEQREAVQQQAVEQEPKPVVNAEGQTTGSVINVTA